MKKLALLGACAIVAFTQLRAQNVVISLDKFHYTRGEDIVVSYTNGAENEKDYMGIAPLGQEITGIQGGYTTTYAYLDNPGAKEGTGTILGSNMGSAEDGFYWVVYLLNDGYNAASEYLPLYYGDELPQNEAPALTIAECTEEYTTVTFTDNELWRNLIKGINVDGADLSTDDYTVEPGELYILKDLRAAKTLVITAWAHNDATAAFSTTSIDDNRAEHMSFSNGVLSLSATCPQSVSVISLTGAVEAVHMLAAGKNTLDLSYLNAGVHLLKVTAQGTDEVMKIVIR